MFPFNSLRVLSFLLPSIACAAHAAGAPSMDAADTAVTYVAENRSIMSSGIAHTFVLAHPATLPSGVALPLVFSYHSDGGTGAGMRAGLPLETEALTGAVFIYPNAPGGIFDTDTSNGRTVEQTFVSDVTAAMRTEFGITPGRVFIAGFSKGAFVANILGCRLGPGVIRGLGINSGGIYSIGDFGYTANGGITCPLPAAIIIWGANDTTVPFNPDGLGYRDIVKATQGCGMSTTPWPVAECVAYDSCTRGLSWCPIPNFGHGIWSAAAHAIWIVFDDLQFANGFD